MKALNYVLIIFFLTIANLTASGQCTNCSGGTVTIHEEGSGNSKIIFHEPKLFFKLKIQACSPGNPYFPTE